MLWSVKHLWVYIHCRTTRNEIHPTLICSKLTWVTPPQALSRIPSNRWGIEILLPSNNELCKLERRPWPQAGRDSLMAMELITLTMSQRSIKHGDNFLFESLNFSSAVNNPTVTDFVHVAKCSSPVGVTDNLFNMKACNSTLHHTWRWDSWWMEL